MRLPLFLTLPGFFTAPRKSERNDSPLTELASNMDALAGKKKSKRWHPGTARRVKSNSWWARRQRRNRIARLSRRKNRQRRAA